jgi:hypothetical protein
MRGLIGSHLLRQFIENIQHRINFASTDGATANPKTEKETTNGAENPPSEKDPEQATSEEPQSKQQATDRSGTTD